MIRQLLPAGPALAGAQELLPGTGLAGTGLAVGDERAVAFLDDLGGRLLHRATVTAFPDLAPLGRYLRRPHLRRLVAEIPSGDDQLVSSRGLIFHVAPANADPLFAYCWALAVLTGNSNIVRISGRAGAATDAIISAAQGALADADPIIAGTQRLVGYDHDDTITAALSAACDLRVVWGGNDTVGEFRRVPVSPYSGDLAFPDRASFAAIDAAGFRSSSDAVRRRIVAALCTDTYLFDQAACASPRAVLWVGSAPDVTVGRRTFSSHLADLMAARPPVIDPAMAVEKLVNSFGLAADGAAEAVSTRGAAITEITLTGAAGLPRGWSGAGVFAHRHVATIEHLVDLLQPTDQTLTYACFPPAELARLARLAAQRGIDRVVPAGQALTFHHRWDGRDLLYEFTRRTSVPAPPAGAGHAAS